MIFFQILQQIYFCRGKNKYNIILESLFLETIFINYISKLNQEVIYIIILFLHQKKFKSNFKAQMRRNITNPELLLQELRRVRLRNIQLEEQVTKLTSQPKPDKKILIEFGIPENLQKSNQPFLWEKLITQNTTLKNKINELQKQIVQIKIQTEKQNQQLKKKYEKIVIDVKQQFPLDLIPKLKQKIEQLESKLKQHRLNESQLKMIHERDMQQIKQLRDFIGANNFKYSKFGQLQVKLHEINQEKNFYKQKSNELLASMFRDKFPNYQQSVKSVLSVFRKLQKIKKLQNEQKEKLVLQNVLFKVLYVIDKVKNKVSDYIQVASIKKNHTQQPQNLELIESMIQRFKRETLITESEALLKMKQKEKQYNQLQNQYLKIWETCQRYEEYIQKLERNNQSILLRNTELQNSMKLYAYDFGYVLYSKFRRFEQQVKNSVESEKTDHQFKNFGTLVQPQYQAMKSLALILKQANKVNRTLIQDEKNGLLSTRQQKIKQQLQTMNQNEKIKQERRQVVILKKNIYGYWNDPNFVHSIKPTKKKTYQRLLDKSTQTLDMNLLQQLRFFKLIVYNANIRINTLKLDPFIKLLYSFKIYQTSVKSGKEPYWNEEFIFLQKETNLEIEVYDNQHLGRNTLLGLSKLNLSKILLSTSVDPFRIELKLEDTSKGFLGKLWLGVWRIAVQKVIHLRQIEAQINIQTDLLADMDPFCIFKSDNKQLDRTTVLRNGGNKPKWREEFLLILENNNNQQFKISVVDKDILVDDKIGSAKIKISEIPEQEEEMALDLINVKQQKTGIIRFKIRQATYTNSNIKSRQPYLKELIIEDRIYFVVDNIKAAISKYTILSPAFYLNLGYQSQTKTLKVCKGLELFWPEPLIFYYESSFQNILIQLFEKAMIGEDKPICQTTLSLKNSIKLNYEDVDTIIQNITTEDGKSIRLSQNLTILNQIEVIFIELIELEFLKKGNLKKNQENLVLLFRINPNTFKHIQIPPISKQQGNIFRYENFIEIPVLQSAGQEWKFMKIEAFQGNEATVPVNTLIIKRQNILEDFIGEISEFNKMERQGTLKIRLGRHTFTNILKKKPKEKIKFEIPFRNYFSLVVCKAHLSRDTELLGNMQSYCWLKYNARQYKSRIQKGKNPIWNQSFYFMLNSSTEDLSKNLQYIIYDHETMKNDDLVGQGILAIQKYFEKGEEEIVNPLYFQRQTIGTIYFKLLRVPELYLLKIVHVRVEIYQDTDWIGKIDPFVEFKNAQILLYKTTVLNQFGQNPEWDCSFEIEFEDTNKFILQAFIYDKDLIGSDFHGKARFELKQFSEYFDEVVSILKKDDQEYGKIYLTAAYTKFTVNLNNRKKSLNKIPSFFNINNLELFKLNLLRLKYEKKQYGTSYLKYSYPFEHFTESLSGKDLFFNDQMVLAVKNQEVLEIQIHSSNMLGLTNELESIVIPRLRSEGSKKLKYFDWQEYKIVEKNTELGKLSIAIEKVQKQWIIYIDSFQVTQINNQQNLQSCVCLLKSDSESRKINLDNFQKTQVNGKNKLQSKQFIWIYSEIPYLYIQIYKKSGFMTMGVKQNLLSSLKIDLQLIQTNYLKWRDFELYHKDSKQLLCLLSLFCSKMYYEDKFNFTCLPLSLNNNQNTLLQLFIQINIKKLLTKKSKQKNDYRLVFKNGLMSKCLKEKESIIQSQYESSNMDTILQIYDRQQIITSEKVNNNDKKQKINHIWIKKEGKIGELAGVLIFQKKLQKINTISTSLSLFRFKHLRIKPSDQTLILSKVTNIDSSYEFILVIANNQTEICSNQRIGEYCWFREFELVLNSNVTCNEITIQFKIKKTDNKIILFSEKVALKYEANCYFQNKITNQRIICYYEVTAHINYIKQNEFRQVQKIKSNRKDQQFFKISEINVKLFQQLGYYTEMNLFCILEYDNNIKQSQKESTHNLLWYNNRKYIFKRNQQANILDLLFYEHKKNIISGESDSVFAGCKISLMEQLTKQQKGEWKKIGELKQKGEIIGTVELRFTFLEDLVYKKIEIKRVVMLSPIINESNYKLRINYQNQSETTEYYMDYLQNNTFSIRSTTIDRQTLLTRDKELEILQPNEQLLLEVVQMGQNNEIIKDKKLNNKEFFSFGRSNLLLQLEQESQKIKQQEQQYVSFQTNEFNGYLAYSLKTIKHHHNYKEATTAINQNSAQLSSFDKQICLVNIESVLVQTQSNCKIFFKLEILDEIFYSPHYQLKGQYMVTKFQFFIEASSVIRIEMWRRDAISEVFLGRMVKDLRKDEKNSFGTFFSDNSERITVAVALIEVDSNIAFSKYQNFMRIKRISADQLRDTQLLTHMNPYINFSYEDNYNKYIYRTGLAVGKVNLLWNTNFIFPQIKQKKLKIEVIDKDLMYDDQIGVKQITNLQQLLDQNRTTRVYELEHKGKVSGKINLVCENIKPKKMIRQEKIPEINKKNSSYHLAQFIVKQVQIVSVINSKQDLLMRIAYDGNQHYEKYFKPIYRIGSSNKIFYFQETSQLFLTQQNTRITLQIYLIKNTILSIGNSGILLCECQIELINNNKLSSSNQEIKLSLNRYNKKDQKLGDLIYYTKTLKQDKMIILSQLQFFVPTNKTTKKWFCLSNQGFYYQSRKISSQNLVQFIDYVSLKPNQNYQLLLGTDDQEMGKFILTPDMIKVRNQLIYYIENIKKEINVCLCLGFSLPIIIQKQQSVGQQYPENKIQQQQSVKKWIKLNIIKAQLTRDVQLLGKMDPYCVIKCNTKQYKTHVLDDVGKLPVWNQQFMLEYNITPLKANIEVYDSEVTIDRIVGSTQFLFELPQVSLKNRVIDILYKQKSAGKVSLEYCINQSYVRIYNIRILRSGSSKDFLQIDTKFQNQKIEGLKDIEKMTLDIPLTSQDTVKVKFGKQLYRELRYQELKYRKELVVFPHELQFSIRLFQ